MILEEPFGYALNQDNELVHIDQALQHRHLGHSYRCLNPECNTEMLMVQGKVRISHFRHKNAVCCPETYQHQLAKKLIQLRIHSKKPTILAFDCSICGDPKAKQVDLSKILSHAVLEQKYPESNFIGDVAAFNQNNELKVMFEVYVTHKVDGEKLNQPKWVEVHADQVIRENYLNGQAVVWRAKRSCADIKCPHCEEVVRQLQHQDQNIRVKALVDRRKQLKDYGDLYFAGMDDMTVTGLSDLNFICDQIEQREREVQLPYISLLYELHFVKSFCLLLSIDAPICKRAEQLAVDKLKHKFWKKAYKQKKMILADHLSESNR